MDGNNDPDIFRKYGPGGEEENDGERRPASEERPTDPGARLRRLLAGDEDESTGQTGPVTSRHPTGEPDATGGWYAQPSQGAPGTGDEEETNTGVTSRHPTGEPDSTGGWYGQQPPVTPPTTPDNAQTRPVPSEPPPPADSTRPTESSVQRSEQPTIPPPFGIGRGTPLPRRVEETDPNATRVTPAAYNRSPQSSATRPTYSTQNAANQYTTPTARPVYGPPAPPAAPPRTVVRRKPKPRSTGCVTRAIVAALFLALLALVVAASFGIYQYFSIAATLPSVEDLRARASQFETTRILDRDGNVLYEILDPNAGRRTYVPLAKISPYLVAATIATEDKEFYSHPGYDPVAIARALVQNYTGQSSSGASTITQQLARTLLMTPSERVDRSVQRKAREIVLAAEITRRYSKDEILELYLNENYYGNLAYGIEAAAETYFNTSAEALTLGQASFLAGLPQAPSVYDIYANREATLNRQKQVLVLMYEDSQSKNCIPVSNSPQPVCVSAMDVTLAAQEIENYTFERNFESMRYPHWVTFIRSLLETQYDAQTIYRSGFSVYTTLDPRLQDMAQSMVQQQVATLADRHVTNGALVSIRPDTGEILAMVGSADFNNEAISGQVNMAISPRQPGSSIKPITYAAAFEKGWTPSTLIWDVPSEFPPSGDPNDPREPYRPVNYDERFHGPVLLRDALANSYNIPAVKSLDFVRIYDDPNTSNPDGMINMAKRLGITTLTLNDYGLSLTLGGGDVSLLELTSAYSVFANSGRRMPPLAITRIVDFQGNTVYDYQAPAGEQVIRAEHAYLLTSILSDNNARAPMFGVDSVLNLPFQVAAKTGTTNSFRDNWTLGYTPDLVTGVWVGNADYTPMVNTSGLTGAAPIWSQFMQQAVPLVTGNNPRPFNRPAGIVDKVVCAVSGSEPSEWCPAQKSEIFAFDQGPKPKEEDLWRRVSIDTWTGLRASAYCADFVDDKFALNVTDPWAIRWIREDGNGQAWAESMGFEQPIAFAPDRECKEGDPRPTIHFAGLNEGQTITDDPLDVYAVVYADVNFRDYRLEWGTGDDPVDWRVLQEGMTNQYRSPERIYSWDMEDVPSGTITLRLYMNSTVNTYAERRIHLNIQVPTPTATVTPTATTTNVPSQTPTETQVPSATPTETQQPTVEATAAPTGTQTTQP